MKSYEYKPVYNARKELVRIAIDLHRSELFNIKGVNGISIGSLEKGKPSGYCIEIRIDSEKHTSRLPAYLKMYNERGRTVRIPVRKIISGKATAHSASVGGRIANKSDMLNQGTLGYFVRSRSNGEIFLISCYHVLRFDHDWTIFSRTNHEKIVDVSSPTGDIIGQLCFGFRNTRFDIGLARLTPGTSHVIPPSLIMIRSVDVFPEDEYTETPVFVRGINSKELRKGFVYNDEVRKEIHYSDGSSQVFEKLMSITRRTGNRLVSVTAKGDSGALVFNENMEAMGLILGGDDYFSYAMHMKDLEQQIQVDILT